jgi:hypothetical protein
LLGFGVARAKASWAWARFRRDGEGVQGGFERVGVGPRRCRGLVLKEDHGPAMLKKEKEREGKERVGVVSFRVLQERGE